MIVLDKHWSTNEHQISSKSEENCHQNLQFVTWGQCRRSISTADMLWVAQKIFIRKRALRGYQLT